MQKIMIQMTIAINKIIRTLPITILLETRIQIFKIISNIKMQTNNKNQIITKIMNWVITLSIQSLIIKKMIMTEKKSKLLMKTFLRIPCIKLLFHKLWELWRRPLSWKLSHLRYRILLRRQSGRIICWLIL